MDFSVKKAMPETLMANASKLAHHNAVEGEYRDIVAHIVKDNRMNLNLNKLKNYLDIFVRNFVNDLSLM